MCHRWTVRGKTKGPILRQNSPVVSLFFSSPTPLLSNSFRSISFRSISSPSLPPITRQQHTVLGRSFSGQAPVIKIEFPALSPTMTTGDFIKWNKKIGDQVGAGDSLAEIETDKATLSYDSQEEGYLAAQFVDDKTKEVKIGTLLGWLVTDKSEIAVAQVEAEKLKRSGTSAKTASYSSTPSTSSTSGPLTNALTPAVVHLILEHKLDPASIKPTGRRGRLLKGDVLAALEAGTAKTKTSEKTAPIPAAAPHSSASSNPPSFDRRLRVHTDIPASEQRKTHASELKQVKSIIPHNYTKATVRVDNLLKLVTQTERKNEKTSLNDWVIRAAALSMRTFPRVNALWDVETQEPKQLSDVNIAVIVPLSSGAFVSVPITHSDRMGPLAISKFVEQRGRESNTTSTQPASAFTVSNLGSLGVLHFNAIIHPNQTAFLAVGAPQTQFLFTAFTEDDAGSYSTHPLDITNLQRGTFVNVTLSCDERVVDPALAAQWLAKFSSLLQDPQQML